MLNSPWIRIKKLGTSFLLYVRPNVLELSLDTDKKIGHQFFTICKTKCSWTLNDLDQSEFFTICKTKWCWTLLGYGEKLGTSFLLYVRPIATELSLDTEKEIGHQIFTICKTNCDRTLKNSTTLCHKVLTPRNPFLRLSQK